jgi:hypothetical protein
MPLFGHSMFTVSLEGLCPSLMECRLFSCTDNRFSIAWFAGDESWLCAVCETHSKPQSKSCCATKATRAE